VQVPFDSPDALWRTVHVTLDVDEVLSGEIPNGSGQITVGLGIGDVNADEAHIRDGLVALGRTVWFLRDDSPVFAYDRTLYSDIEDGRLVAPVASDGTCRSRCSRRANPPQRRCAAPPFHSCVRRRSGRLGRSSFTRTEAAGLGSVRGRPAASTAGAAYVCVPTGGGGGSVTSSGGGTG
jgi:hypothetical protein